MATTIATAQRSEPTGLSRVLREIAVGGLAGLLVGVLLGGIGGRVVMRTAALLVPDSVGRFTENGNRIGTITLEGSLLLLVFVGLLAGTFAASIWVIVRPWLPATIVGRALVATPLAIGLGVHSLVDGRNPDFTILGHDPLVVAVLIGLIALFGPAMAIADAWMDRRLPDGAPRTASGAAYGVIAGLGVLLTALMVVPALVFGPLAVAGWAMAVAGMASLIRWSRVVEGALVPAVLPWVARGAIVAATVASLVAIIPDVRGALGMG